MDDDGASRMLEKRNTINDRVPTKYHPLFKRAYSGRSRKAAIRANCLECMCFSEKEVRTCPIPHCPMYLYRLGAARRYEGVGIEIQEGVEGLDTDEWVETPDPPLVKADGTEG